MRGKMLIGGLLAMAVALTIAVTNPASAQQYYGGYGMMGPGMMMGPDMMSYGGGMGPGMMGGGYMGCPMCGYGYGTMGGYGYSGYGPGTTSGGYQPQPSQPHHTGIDRPIQ